MTQTALKTYVYDIETYPNFFLAVFKEISESRDCPRFRFTWDQVDELKQFLAQEGLRLAGYNNYRFDDTILAAIIEGHVKSPAEACALGKDIIESTDPETRWWPQKSTITWSCIDLMQILGGGRIAGTLKSHQVRLGLLNVVDLPLPPGTVLSVEQKTEVTTYCDNDVDATMALYFDIFDNIAVRDEINARYPHLNGSALRRSNPSIAESVIREEMTKKAAFSMRQYRKPTIFEFNPADRIDADIRFVGEHNQKVLSDLRRFSTFGAEEWAEGLGRRFRFEIGKHKLELTAGGLHTRTGPICVRSNAILEFDVTSYYPNLLRRIDRVPGGLSDKWIEIVNDLTDKRVAAKQAGKKTEADVFKIIVNALYGKLADEYSINYDRNLQLQVVLNGQLFLMMLMERFERDGIQVIAANTDGIYVNAGEHADRARKIADEWQTETGFKLEGKVCTIFAASSVNDYALYELKKGWFNKKGRFGVGKRSHPAIIFEAVLALVGSNKPIDETVRECSDLRNFLYSGTVNRKFEVRRDGIELQRTNRWYRGVDGKPIEVIVEAAEGEPSIRRVPNSDNSVIANRIADTSIPIDVDIGFYVSEAAAIAAEIVSGDGSQLKLERPTLIGRALDAQHLGLTIVPKGRYGQEKANVRDTYNPSTISYWRTTALDKAEWEVFEGFGAYTGQEFGIMALDFDVPDHARKMGLYDLIGERGLAIWHGKGSAAAVCNGKKRGTIVFRYDGVELRSTGGGFLKDFGFEVLYGKRVVQLAGYHPSRESYKYAGKLQRLPPELLSRLEWLIDERGDYSSASAASDDGLIDRLTQFQQLANEDPDYRAVSGSLVFANAAKKGVHLKGACIGHDGHTNKQNDQDMTVCVRGGQIHVDCFHQSCARTRHAWQQRIAEQVVVSRKLDAKPEIVIVDEVGKKIAQAIDDPSRAKLVIAPTGTGKSYAVVNHIASMLATETGDTFAIICSSKDQMTQFGERFASVLKCKNISEYGIDLIEAEETIRIGESQSRRAVRDDTRVAITHYTYVSRRGFGRFYYAFQKFIDENTHVYVDEVDAFVESQSFQLQLGSRWKSMSREGRTKHEMVRKCGMFHGFNNCLNCVMRKHDGFKVGLDAYQNPTYEPVPHFMTGERREALKRIEVDDETVQKTMVGSTEVSMLRQDDDAGEMKFDDQTEGDNFEVRFNDHIKSAYLPTVHRAAIMYDGVEVDRENVILRYKVSGRTNLAISEQERRKVKFPSRACNVLTVVGIDRRPMIRMAAAKSFTGLSATLTPQQKCFLADMLGSLKVFDVEPDEERRMDKILVVGTSQQIPVDMIGEGLWRFGKMLRFRETASKAREDFKRLQRSPIRLKMGINTKEFVITEEFGNDHQVLLTYSLGSLGRGVDLPSYDVVCVNASIYKPICAYVTDDPSELRTLMNEDRANTVAQNIGRILRRANPTDRAVRLIVIEELESVEEFAAVVQQMQRMSIEQVESWWVPPFVDAEETCRWLSSIFEGGSIPADVPRDPSDLLARAERLIGEGASKKELKIELRWSTIRKKLETREVEDLEVKIDQMFAARSPEVRDQRLATPEKTEKQRSRRLNKIRELIERGKNDGQIRSDMKVYGSRLPWRDMEQRWFEQVLQSERNARLMTVSDDQKEEVSCDR